MADRRPARRSEAGAARQAPPGACLLVPPGLAPHRSVMNMSPIRLAMLPAANRPPLPVPPRPAQRQAGAAPAWRVSDAAGPGRARPCRLLRREGLPPGGKIPRTTTATAAIVGRARRQRLYHGPLRLNAGPRPSEPDAVAVQRLCQDPMHLYDAVAPAASAADGIRNFRQDPMHLYGAPAPAQPAAAGTRKSRQDPMHLHGALAPRAAAAADETRSFRQNSMHQYGVLGPAEPSAAGIRNFRQDPMHLYGGIGVRREVTGSCRHPRSAKPSWTGRGLGRTPARGQASATLGEFPCVERRSRGWPACAGHDGKRTVAAFWMWRFCQDPMHLYGGACPPGPATSGTRRFCQDPMHLYGGGVRPSPHSLNSRKSATTPYARSSACPTPTRRHAGVTSPQPRATSCPP
jgi:hypothetical protein